MKESSGVAGSILPMKHILALCFIQLCDMINGSAIYPYIIFLVQSFDLTPDERKLGYYAGLLGSSYYVAQLLSSLLWGLASDRFGRRPCLLFGLFSSMATVLLFGFSDSLTWAIVTRFLSGLMNGNTGITKTMLGEISTSATQARAFSYFGFTVGASSIIGPLIGGVLASPSSKYPTLFGNVGLFKRYPYCLPNLIVGALSMAGLIIGFFVLPETRVWKGNNKLNEKSNTILDILLAKLPFRKSTTRFIKLQELSQMEDPFYPNDETIPTDDGATVNPDKFDSPRPTKLALLRDKGVLISCVLYALIGLLFVFYEEVTPYWSFLSVEDGGLDFSSTDIGVLYSIGSVVGMVFQMFAYPNLARRLGVVKAFRLGAIFILPGLALLPQVPAIALALTSNRKMDTNPVAWLVLIIASLLVQIGGELLFVSVMILISNSAHQEMMGTVNGLAQSLVAFTRTMAPIAGSSILSWSLTNNLPFPFNYQFTFIVMILISLSVVVLSYYTPTSLLQKKEVEKETEKETKKEKQALLNNEEEEV